MPRYKKPAGTTVNPRNGRKVELVPKERDKIPTLPLGWANTRKAKWWVSYWSDVVSGLVYPSEEYLVVRWLSNVERYEKLLQSYDEMPEIIERDEDGNIEKITPNPALHQAMKLEVSIRADEAQLGVGPRNRAALGIALVRQEADHTKLRNEQAKQSAPATKKISSEIVDPRLDDDE